MSQITRVIASPTTNAFDTNLEPTLETILIELGMQDSIRSIREATLINSGRTLRFVYTNDTIKDVDLPQTIQAISIQKQGDNNIMTIRGTDGSIVVYTIESNLITYNVVPKDDSVTITQTGDERNITFEVKANIPTINDGTLTLKQGDIVLGTFTANQVNDTIVQIPIISGQDGEQGIQGEKGEDGDSAYVIWLKAGNRGTEEDFLDSLKGTKGDKGDKGDTGEQGLQGVQGIQGIQGAKGDKGDPFTIAKTYSSVAEMQDDLPYMEINDYVMIASSVEDADNAKLYVKTTNGWSFITDFSGATGIKGEKGDTGEQGIQGIQGVAGAQGAKGDNGQDGKSAYQIAVDNGFVGTELEWLSSLKGEKGDKGDKGDSGDSGDAPVTDVKVNGTSVLSNKIANIQVTDNNVTLAYGQTSTIAKIHNIPIRVTLPEKPEYEGIDIEFYDITAKNELDFFKAVAISRGYPINQTNEITAITDSNKSYVTTGYAVDGVVTPVQVRVHLASDITLTNCLDYNLSTVTVNGNDYSLKYTDPLKFRGRSCKFNNTRFEVVGEEPNKSDYLITFYGDLDVHNKYTFDKCQFNGSVKQSSGRSNNFIKVFSTSSSTSCTIYFYFCTWVTNSGTGDNSTLVSGGKITINFGSPIGSPNLKILSNLGTGVIGSHSCSDFDVSSAASVSGEFIYDSSSSLTKDDNKVIARNIFGD